MNEKVSKKRVRKTGFTLIELLITIAILAILFIVCFVIALNLFDNSDEKIKEVTKKMIVDTAEKYALEFKNSDKWKESIGDDETYFCISLDSLINYGYFKDEKISKYKDDYIIRTVIKNGVYSSKILKKGDLELNDCSYNDNMTSIGEVDSTSTDIKENGNKIGSFSYNIDSINDKLVKTSINFSLDFNINEMITSAPVYITLIVDNSGSMENSGVYDDAKEAAVNFSEKILEDVPDANIALVSFDINPRLSRTFKNEALSYSNFPEPVYGDDGTTNIGGGIDYVSSMIHNGIINGTIPQNASFYTLLLYDGYPTHYPSVNNYDSVSINGDESKIDAYFLNFMSNNVENMCVVEEKSCFLFFCQTSGFDYDPCNDYILASGEYLKNIYNSKLILFGYEIDEGVGHKFDEEKMKQMASYDVDFCKNSDYGNYCYYDSNSDSVLELFENISSQIIETEKSINANRISVKLTPTKLDNGESAFDIMKDGAILQDNMIVLEKDIDSLEESMEINLSETYGLVLNDSLFSDCVDFCSKELKLFDITLVFEYDDKAPEEFSIDNPLTVVVSSKREYVIN